MLSTLLKETGLALSYVREEFLDFLPLNTVQYRLEDEKGEPYLLLLSFDGVQVFDLDQETKEDPLVWSGKLLNHRASLYHWDESKRTSPKRERIFQSRKPTAVLLSEEESKGMQAQFALNNYPLIYPQNSNHWIEITTDGEKEYLPVSVAGRAAELGTWMNPVSREGLLAAVTAVFDTFPAVKTLNYQNVLYDTLLDHGWRHNDFYLPLPDSAEALKARLAAKSRYNIRREKRIIEETFGGLVLEDVSCDQIPEDLKSLFYTLKNATHGVSEESYDIDEKPITNVYLLRVGTGEVKGMALSCEQGPIVFLENHTFDSTMRKYSFGQVLYDLYLEAMIEKKKTGVALAGGSLEYKKRYGTYCAIARSGSIQRVTVSWLKVARAVGISPGSKFFRRVANKLVRLKKRV